MLWPTFLIERALVVLVALLSVVSFALAMVDFSQSQQLQGGITVQDGVTTISTPLIVNQFVQAPSFILTPQPLPMRSKMIKRNTRTKIDLGNNGELLLDESQSLHFITSQTDVTLGPNIANVSTIQGTDGNARNVNDLVTSSESSVTTGAIAVFSDTSGRTLQASTISVDHVVNSTGSATLDHLITYADSSGQLIQDSGVDVNSLITSPLTNDLDVNNNDLTNVANITGSVKTAVVNDLITNAGSGTNNNIATFSGSKTIQDSGVLVTALITNPLSANLDVNSHELTNVAALRPATSGRIVVGTSAAISTGSNNVAIGTSATVTGTNPNGIAIGSSSTTTDGISIGPSNTTTLGSIAIGSSNSASASQAIAIGNSITANGSNNGVAIGNTVTTHVQSVAIGDGVIANSQQCVVIGYQSSIDTSANNCTAIGGATVATGANDSVVIGHAADSTGIEGIAIGHASTAWANQAIAIGITAQNTDASTCLIGDTAISNIRPNNTGLCTLGTSVARFSDAHLSGSLIGSTKTSLVNDIITNDTGGTSGNVAAFTGTATIKDSGTALTALLTSPLTANLDVGAHELTNTAALRPATSGRIVIGTSAAISTGSNNVAIGTSATVTGTNPNGIAIGSSATTTNGISIGPSNTTTLGSIAIGSSSGASASQAIAIGNGANANSADSGIAMGASSTTNIRALAIGLQSTVSSQQGIAIGYQTLVDVSSNDSVVVGTGGQSTGSEGIALGHLASAGANQAIALGASAQNTSASTCLIGDSAISNIRPNNSGACTLGTASARFSDAHLSGSIIGTTKTSVVNDIVTSPLSANLDVNSNELTNVAAIRPINNRIIIGTSASSTGSGVIIGQSAVGSTAVNVVSIGNGAQADNTRAIAIGATANANDPDTIAIGSNTTVNFTAQLGIAIGNNASISGPTVNSMSMGNSANCSGNHSIALGDNAASSGDNAIAIGTSAVNSVSNSCLIGASSIGNLRPNNNNTCDLGVSGAQWRDLYIARDVFAPSARLIRNRFSMYGPVTVTNTISTTSLSTGTSVGSLSFSNTQQSLGQVIYLKAMLNGISTTPSPDAQLQLKWRVNGGAFATHTIAAIPATFDIVLKAKLVIISSSAAAISSQLSRITTSPASPTQELIYNNNFSYNMTITNAFELTATWDQQTTSDSVTAVSVTLDTIS